MISFPNCKINLGLRIGETRPDGYHEIESVFYPIPLYDALELIEFPGSTGCKFAASGIKIDGAVNDNLCVKSYDILKRKFPGIPGIHLHLHKAIPLGAGLGGGSADAAFTLTLLNQKFQLGISKEELKRLSAELGSDCPFFIDNVPALVQGRGEKVGPISIDLSGFSILIVNPGIHINTGWAFGKIQANQVPLELSRKIHQPISTWKEWLVNDFEAVICEEYFELRSIRSTLYNHNALYASMTGSGSSFYGIFEKKQAGINFPSHYFWKWV